MRFYDPLARRKSDFENLPRREKKEPLKPRNYLKQDLTPQLEFCNCKKKQDGNIIVKCQAFRGFSEKLKSERAKEYLQN